MQDTAKAGNAFPYLQTLTPKDNDNHEIGPETIWQESSYVMFADPAHGLAGLHRIGIYPNRGEANIFSWTQIDGKIVSRAKRTGLPLPRGPITGTTIDGITFDTTEPLRKCHILVNRDNVQTDVVFESFTGPVEMSLDGGGALVGKGHYDSLGRVSGTMRAHGKTYPFDGVGFLDHSWGPRDARGIVAHRWIMAVLDEANHLNAFPKFTRQGRVMQGYLMLDGTLSTVANVQSELFVADDPLQANGLRATVTDRLGRSITLNGSAAGEYCVQPYTHGYFCQQQPMIYECGRRFWRGVLEWSSPRFIPPWHLETLGMSADDEWLRLNSFEP